MQTSDLKPTEFIISDIITDNELKKIDALSSDIRKLKNFVDLLATHKDEKIKALYIVTDAGFQIELKGNFSNKATEKLLNLIIESRRALAIELQQVLNDLINKLN